MPSAARAGLVRARVLLSLSSTRDGFEALGPRLGSLFSSSLGFLAESVWGGAGEAPEMDARAPPGRSLRAAGTRTGQRMLVPRPGAGLWPGRGQGCALALSPSPPFPRGPGTMRGPGTQDSRHRDPDSELSARSQ